jgi:haloalkane dehalogenase
MLQWPRMMPLDGDPPEVVDRVRDYGRWLADSAHTPKLLLTCPPGPGLMMTPDLVAWCRTHIAALETAAPGASGHHVPIDQSPAIAEELSELLLRHDLCSTPTADRQGAVVSEDG